MKSVPVPNDLLLQELRLSHAQGKMTDRLVKLLMTMVERYAMKHNFRGYSYIEDMKAEAILKLLSAWPKFDINQSNPFCYFTVCIHRVFIQYLKQERRHRDIRDELIIEQGASPSWSYEAEE